jgi:hypothetical protein
MSKSGDSDLSSYSSSKQVIGHKTCYDLTEEFSCCLFMGWPVDLSLLRFGSKVLVLQTVC